MFFWRLPRVTTALVFCAALIGTGCSVSVDQAASLDKQAILDGVDSALTVQDCAAAIEKITPLYESSASDNEVRLKAASAYACYARINFFKTMGDLAEVAPSMASGTGLWSSMAQLFPSTAGTDYVVEGGLLGMDALQAALTPGALILPIYQVNAGGFNVGSVFPTDRISDANIYLTFISMAALGGLENRYGFPDATTHVKTTALPWTTYDQMTATSDGCAMASAMLNVLDSMNASKDVIGGSVAESFTTVTSLLEGAFDLACGFGCAGLDHATIDLAVPGFLAATNPTTGNAGGWTDTGCSATCSECPKELRDRRKCTGANDQVSCAAAGLINFMNAGAYGWN